MAALAPADVSELKKRLLKLIGPQRAERYFYQLNRLISNKITKPEFNRMCLVTIGKENLGFHNLFIRAIIGNAVRATRKPCKVTVTGQSGTNRLREGNQSLLPLPSPRGIRSARSPLGKPPLGHDREITNSCDPKRLREMPGVLERRSSGSKAPLEVISVEDGEEVVSGSPCVQSRSPIPAPFGITKPGISTLSQPRIPNLKVPPSLSCYGRGELPETSSLNMEMARRLESEGLGVSTDCANLLNCALDVFIKGMIKPVMDLSRARPANIHDSHSSMKLFIEPGTRLKYNRSLGLSQSHSATLQDFLVAMESNPCLLGVDWPLQLEKIRGHLEE